MSTKNILLCNLDKQFGRYIKSELMKSGILIPDALNQNDYDIIGKRIQNVYSRLNSYSDKFIKSWSSNRSPGYVVFLSDGESIRSKDIQRMKRYSSEKVFSGIRSSKIVCVFGDIVDVEFECYITKRRYDEEKRKGNKDVERIKIYSDQPKGIYSLCLYTIFKTNNLIHLNRAPNFLKAFDSAVIGINIWDASGDLNSHIHIFKRACVSVNGISDSILISDVYNVMPEDRLLIVDESLLTRDQINLQNELYRHFKKNGYMIIGTNTMNRFHFIHENRSFVVDCMYSCNGDMFLSSEKFSYLSFLSFGRNVYIDGDFKIRMIDSLSTRYSEALFMTINRMRKTFIDTGDYMICIIANKGSYKTTIIDILRNNMDDDVVIIDSDYYGKWINYLMSESDIPFDDVVNDIRSFFNISAEEHLKTNFDTLTKYNEFKQVYARVLASDEYGLTKFQIMLGEKYPGKKLILFCHCTVEANLLSGNWQFFSIEPIHNAYMINVKRSLVDAFLYEIYSMMNGDRNTINWFELLVVLCPSALTYIKERL